MLNNAEIVLIPSAFTKDTGKCHWEVLLRARAIENQCYIIAAAQCGRHNLTRVSHGQSMCIDPWGKIVSSCIEYDPMLDTDHEANLERWEGFCVAKFNRNLLQNIRDKMPVLLHRRNDIYNSAN
jgi:predicted amidohydrolase